MKEIGTVESVNDNFAEVRIKRVSACGENCAQCKAGCKNGEMVVTAVNSIGAKNGEKVVLEMKTAYVFHAAFMVYILPLILFFAAYVSVYVMFSNETAAVIAAICGLVIGFAAAKLADKAMGHKSVPIIKYVL